MATSKHEIHVEIVVPRIVVVGKREADDVADVLDSIPSNDVTDMQAAALSRAAEWLRGA